jgi:hypothetical protein
VLGAGHREVELLVEPLGVLGNREREQLVAQVHQCAPVASGVLAYRTLQLVGHQRRVARGGEEVVQHPLTARARRRVLDVVENDGSVVMSGVREP